MVWNGARWRWQIITFALRSAQWSIGDDTGWFVDLKMYSLQKEQCCKTVNRIYILSESDCTRGSVMHFTWLCMWIKCFSFPNKPIIWTSKQISNRFRSKNTCGSACGSTVSLFQTNQLFEQAKQISNRFRSRSCNNNPIDKVSLQSEALSFFPDFQSRC